MPIDVCPAWYEWQHPPDAFSRDPVSGVEDGMCVQCAGNSNSAKALCLPFPQTFALVSLAAPLLAFSFSLFPSLLLLLLLFFFGPRFDAAGTDY